MQQQRPTVEQLAAQLNAMGQNFQVIYDRLIAAHRRVSALEADRLMRSLGRTIDKPIEFRSQFAEDACLWDLLHHELEAGKPQGLIIEVGAFDGVSFSASFGLERCGWKCLLIEAIPMRFEQCKRNRPDARVVHAALGAPGAPATAEFTVVDDHWGGMLSYLTADADHKAAIEANKQKSTKVTVPRTTMNALLEQHPGPFEIDAAIIDVEGGEPDLIAGFDLLKWKPKVLMIEDNHQQSGTPIDLVMRAQPYSFIGMIAVNRLYIRSDLASTWAKRLT